jgi:hypothetical protein
VFLTNSGNTADTVTSVTLNGNHGTATLAPVAPATTLAIPANSHDVEVDLTGFTNLDSGTQVTATVTMQSGASISQTVTVT